AAVAEGDLAAAGGVAGGGEGRVGGRARRVEVGRCARRARTQPERRSVGARTAAGLARELDAGRAPAVDGLLRAEPVLRTLAQVAELQRERGAAPFAVAAERDAASRQRQLRLERCPVLV